MATLLLLVLAAISELIKLEQHIEASIKFGSYTY